jgi:hypothetical protein
VLAQVAGVRVQPQRLHGLVGGLGGLQVGGERHLGVDHDVLAAGQAHHHVRAQRPGVDRHLLVEVDPRAHPGQLDHPPQLQFPPAPAHLGPAQRRDQRRGLIAELLGGLPGQVYLLGQRRV